MGQKQSCYRLELVKQIEDFSQPSFLYIMYFVCASLPTHERIDPIAKILYAENWCLNEGLWRNYIQNAFAEVESYIACSPSPKKTKISRFKVHTRIHGDLIVGNVRWVSTNSDIDRLNDKIKSTEATFFEKGIHFIEPFWTTSIVPHLITKTAIAHVD